MYVCTCMYMQVNMMKLRLSLYINTHNYTLNHQLVPALFLFPTQDHYTTFHATQHNLCLFSAYLFPSNLSTVTSPLLMQPNLTLCPKKNNSIVLLPYHQLSLSNTSLLHLNNIIQLSINPLLSLIKD